MIEHDGVEKIRQRLRVEGTRSAGDDQRGVATALGGAHGNAPEVEHGKHVGVRQLVLQREADDIEGVERGEGLQRGQRQAGVAQCRLHIEPRSIDAFGIHIGPAVEKIVKDLQPLVRLADLVHVGKGEGETQLYGGGVLVHHAALVAEVASGLSDPGQQRLVCCVPTAHHARSSAAHVRGGLPKGQGWANFAKKYSG